MFVSVNYMLGSPLMSFDFLTRTVTRNSISASFGVMERSFWVPQIGKYCNFQKGSGRDAQKKQPYSATGQDISFYHIFITVFLFRFFKCNSS